MMPKTIVIHHSAGSQFDTIKQIDDLHRARGFNKSSLGYYVGYHYLILPSGDCNQTRLDTEMGCHCVPNDGKVGICVVGDFTKMTPTRQQYTALLSLVDELTEKYKLIDGAVRWHGELAKTECPGKPLIEWVKQYRKIGWLKEQIRVLQGLLDNKKERYAG